jgi:hypothetical protein
MHKDGANGETISKATERASMKDLAGEPAGLMLPGGCKAVPCFDEHMLARLCECRARSTAPLVSTGLTIVARLRSFAAGLLPKINPAKRTP